MRIVIVAYENNMVMEENVELCLQRLFCGKKASTGGELSVSLKKITTGDLAREAMKFFEKNRELQRQVNWAGSGEYLKKLEDVLKEMT